MSVDFASKRFAFDFNFFPAGITARFKNPQGKENEDFIKLHKDNIKLVNPPKIKELINYLNFKSNFIILFERPFYADQQ